MFALRGFPAPGTLHLPCGRMLRLTRPSSQCGKLMLSLPLLRDVMVGVGLADTMRGASRRLLGNNQGYKRLKFRTPSHLLGDKPQPQASIIMLNQYPRGRLGIGRCRSAVSSVLSRWKRRERHGKTPCYCVFALTH